MRLFLRAMVIVALLLGGGATYWAQPEAQASCCCGHAADQEDACPCPKPEKGPDKGNGQGPGSRACSQRSPQVALQAQRRALQARRQREARPQPVLSAGLELVLRESPAQSAPGGRSPDLGRHLALLSTHRI